MFTIFTHIGQFQLLDKDPAKRLGVKGCVSGDICDQPFFKGVNFDQLEKKQVIPPFRPQLVKEIICYITICHSNKFQTRIMRLQCQKTKLLLSLSFRITIIYWFLFC
jgi:hypothetical protein